MLREVLFEFTRAGRFVRVAAVDPDTRTEVVVMCPASSTQAQLESAGAAKLAYVLRRRRESGGPRDGDRASPWDGL